MKQYPNMVLILKYIYISVLYDENSRVLEYAGTNQQKRIENAEI